MSAPSPSDTARSVPALHTVLVVLAAMGFGTVPYFAKSLTEAGMDASVIALSRYVIGAAVLSPFLRFGRGERGMTLVGIATGAAMGLGWIGYVAALRAAPVSTVGVLYMTYPVFTIAIGWLVFADRPSRRALLGAGLILLAAILASAPEAVEAAALPALGLALLAPAGFGLGINVLTRILPGLPPLSRMACVSLGSVIGLAPVALTQQTGPLLPATPGGWALLVGIGLGTALIPQLLYTIHAPMIGAARTAVAGSVELPMMFLVGWLAFGERLGPAQLIAGALVVTAILVTPPRRAAGMAARLGAPSKR